MLTTLAADPALSHSPEGRRRRRDYTRVGSDYAVLERLAHPPQRRVIPGEHVTRQTRAGLVGHRDRLILGRERRDRRDGAECFLGEHLHRGIALH